MGAEVLKIESVEYKRVSEKKQLQIMIHEMKADIQKKKAGSVNWKQTLRK